MKKIGFLKSDKENEKRICILPEDLKKIRNVKNIFIEKDYGVDFNISDKEYSDNGCHLKTQQEIIEECDILVDAKIGDAKYLKDCKKKIIFGWIHAVQNKKLTDMLIENENTVYAWEDMFEKGRHVFWKNNEIAGEAAVLHAILLYGVIPQNYKVAVIGNGNTSRGACRILNKLGAKVNVYTKGLEEIFKEEMGQYDIIVNCVLWDTNRNNHIINRKDLKVLKKDMLIIDVSCDKNGAIETSRPTTLNNPIYTVDGVTHYVVDHTPSIVFKTVSIELSNVIYRFIDELIEGNDNECLKKAKIIEKGKILDEKILKYQKREK